MHTTQIRLTSSAAQTLIAAALTEARADVDAGLYNSARAVCEDARALLPAIKPSFRDSYAEHISETIEHITRVRADEIARQHPRLVGAIAEKNPRVVSA